MDIHELAKSYLETKNIRDEKRRIIDYELSKKLKTAKLHAVDVESRLRALEVEKEIEKEEKVFDQYEAELSLLSADLKKQLTVLEANNSDPLRTHVQGKIYIDSYLNENGDIISGSYHKVD